jgi:ketosteroid isomerase-like protein
MKNRYAMWVILLLAFVSLTPWHTAGKLAAAPREDNAALVAQVTAAERAFAKTMADRDFKEFQSFIAADAVFFNGPNALVGRAAVLEAWRAFFQSGSPPFAWAPDQVVVLARGDLALSMGPVTDASGKVLARFNTIWRRQKNGRWQVVFDKGNAVCN